MKEKQLPKKNTFLPVRFAKKRNRRGLAAAALCISLLLLLGAALSLAGPEREYSENENRMLAGKPRVSLSAVLNGKFMQDTESWLTDRFLGRDLLVRARTYLALLGGQTERNGVYIGRDRFLFERPAGYDENRMAATLAAVNAAAGKWKNVRCYMALAPNACEVLPELLPFAAPAPEQAAQIAAVRKGLPRVTVVDLLPALRNAPDREELYCRTDHHWTTRAAEIAFREIASAMALEGGDDFVSYPVCNDFQGTLASSAGFFHAADTITVTVPANLTYTVSYVEEKEERSSVFDLSKLAQKNKYEVFFGGNFAQIRMETDADSDRTLLLVKDSYANCLAPMLLPSFKTVIMVDPRYYRGDLYRLSEREEITDVLWLYNVNTLLSDTSLAAALEQ